MDAAHDKALFAPVELERLAKFEGQGHEGRRGDGLALTLAPRTYEVGDAAVAAAVALGLDLGVQGACRAPLTPSVRLVVASLFTRMIRAEATQHAKESTFARVH